jgi:hypothetical protein
MIGAVNDNINNAFKFFGIRFRGARSFLRDRKIDEYIDNAIAKADNKGLQIGQDRNNLIRGEALKGLNAFMFDNQTEATLKGIDDHNIHKRLFQKLEKNDVKNFLKERAGELKVEGIVGMKAQDIIREDAKKWIENTFKGAQKDQAQKLLDKSSIKSLLRSKTQMSANEASNYYANIALSGVDLSDSRGARNIEGGIEKAEQFMKEYSASIMENKSRLDFQNQKRKNEGAKIRYFRC